MNKLFVRKAVGVLKRKTAATLGRLYPLQPTLNRMASRPFELHLEFTNLCNADCIFCPYQFQAEKVQFMSDEVFEKALGDFVTGGGGSVGLTPIVGDALIDPKFLKRVRRIRSFPQVDRIWLATNAILLDKHGVANVLDSGITAITISTAGFQREMYERVYRNQSYERMRRNVLELVKLNAERKKPLPVTIGLRTDRPLPEVIADPDFQPILAFNPEIDFTWSFTSAGGRIKREALPQSMRLRTVSKKIDPCAEMYNGPVVLPDGRVQSCSCVASMDAFLDLGLGNVMEANLVDLWDSERMRTLRANFGTPSLCSTCTKCDMYRDLEFYRTGAGRNRGRLNEARGRGEVVKTEKARGAFSGG